MNPLPYWTVDRYEELYHVVILWRLEQGLLHQTGLIARYLEILWQVICPAHGSELLKGAAKESF